MALFFATSLGFPTVIWTFFLCIAAFYWLSAIFGIFDLDILDGDIDIDLESSSDLESGSEGLGGLTGFLFTFGLTGVPVTVVFTLMAATGWIACYFLDLYLLPLLVIDWLYFLGAGVALLISFFVSVVTTAVLIRPLKGLFQNHTAATSSSLLGQTGTVTTGSVTNQFGQAELDDGGAGLILQIRAPDNNLIKKGDKVTLAEYNEEENTYRVVSLD